VNHNKLTSLRGLECLPNLENLFFAYNKVKSVEEVINNVVGREKLMVIDYTGNYMEEEEGVREKLLAWFVNLNRIGVIPKTPSRNTYQQMNPLPSSPIHHPSSSLNQLTFKRVPTDPSHD
jgi:Leucine-rich repeat (LRR) protein